MYFIFRFIKPHVVTQIITVCITQVSRSPDDRSTERLFTDDPGKTEVTEFHLWEVRVRAEQNVLRLQVTVYNVFAAIHTSEYKSSPVQRLVRTCVLVSLKLLTARPYLNTDRPGTRLEWVNF